MRLAGRILFGTFLLTAPLGGWQLRRALTLQPPPPGIPFDYAPMASVGTPARNALDDATLDAIARSDPFDVHRGKQPPLPAPAPAAPAPSAPMIANVRLVGTTVLSGDRSFALMQRGTELVRMVRVGQSFGGLTLRTVDRGKVVLSAPDTTFEISIRR